MGTSDKTTWHGYNLHGTWWQIWLSGVPPIASKWKLWHKYAQISVSMPISKNSECCLRNGWSQAGHIGYFDVQCRGKEMSLSRFLGVYYKLPKSDPNAVYLLPNAVYLLQCCFIAANIGWARQCDNSLFPWKLYKINLTALWSRNKHGCKGWELLFQKDVIGHRF